jgi:hypothetical protein
VRYVEIVGLVDAVAGEAGEEEAGPPKRNELIALLLLLIAPM